MERQFKVGDKVIVREIRSDVEFDHLGEIGKITEVLNDDGYGIVFEDYGKWYFTENEIELIEQSPTRLSDVDKVNPPHYKKGSVECIDAIKAATVGKSGFEGYLAGNVIKYVWRYEDKGGEEDLKKASWYLNKLIDERAT